MDRNKVQGYWRVRLPELANRARMSVKRARLSCRVAAIIQVSIRSFFVTHNNVVRQNAESRKKSLSSKR